LDFDFWILGLCDEDNVEDDEEDERKRLKIVEFVGFD